MIYGFYSDTHKGDGSKADNFRRVEPRFIKMLQFLDAICEGIFNLGDDKEVTQGIGSKEEILEDITVEHAEALKIEKSIGVVKVCGNHDEGTIPLKKIDFSPVDGLRIIAEHGHRFDRWCSKLWFIGRIGAKIAGWLERKGFWNAEAILGKFAERVPGRKEKLSTYFDKMKRELEVLSLGAIRGIYLIGHVHRWKIEHVGSDTLVAVGHCSSGHCECVLVDTETGKVKKKKF